MRETLLIFAGLGTVLGKAFHLWTEDIWEGISLGDKNFRRKTKISYLASRLTQARVTIPSPLVTFTM